jgi:hypothetical protein
MVDCSRIYFESAKIEEIKKTDAGRTIPNINNTFRERIFFSGGAYKILCTTYNAIRIVPMSIDFPTKFSMFQILSFLFGRVKHKHRSLVKKNLVCTWNKRTCPKFITLNNKRR